MSHEKPTGKGTLVRLEQGQVDRIADLVAAIGQPEFPEILCDLLMGCAAFDNIVVLAYRPDVPPIELFQRFFRHDSTSHVHEYQTGPYLLDPFYLFCIKPFKPGTYRLRDFAPDRFFRSEYFKTYYEQTNMIDELGLFAPLQTDETIAVSLGRETGSRPFSARAIAAIDTLEPIVRAAMCRHWHAPRMRELTRSSTPHDILPDLLQTSLESKGNPISDRESEVASLVLRGHSTESIGLRLGISPATVKVHRKHIYAKLKISSQAELFKLSLDVLLRDITPAHTHSGV